MNSNQEFIVIGVLGKTRGVTGEIWVTPLTDFPDRFVDMDEIFIESNNRWEKREILSAKLISERPVLSLNGVNTREDAARLTNHRLAVPRDQTVELPEDYYYIFDMIGLTVIDFSSGNTVGKIVDVNSYPANDAYVIERTNGKRQQLPAIDQFVKEVDLDAKQIKIDPAGLI